MATAAIVEILRKHLPKGRPSGGEYVSPCPFHKGGRERRPSFSVNVETGAAFCHTCHQGWSLRTLLRDMGVGGAEIDVVCGRIPPAEKKNPFRATGLFEGQELPEALLGAYSWCPTELLDAGFEIETLEHFEVGFDRKLHRIVYPIRDHQGVLIGLFGRVPDHLRVKMDPKYKPYQKEIEEEFPGYRLGSKRFLWNMHRVYPLAYRGELGQVVVVEGFKQLMWVWQSGYKEVVALLGSHMTKPQKYLLQRLGCPVILFLDGDKAGLEGSNAIARALLGMQKILICEYKDFKGKKQPDDLSKEEVVRCVENATDPMSWRKSNGL